MAEGIGTRYNAGGIPCHTRRIPVIIHSSSHLGTHRGVVAKVQQLLERDFDVTIEARGGRKWDYDLIKKYWETLYAKRGEYVLHIILLGDNDLRKTRISEPVNPKIREFGEEVEQAYNPGGAHTVFVNGVIPFPVTGRPDSPELIENLHRYTRELSQLINYGSSIYFVPMREKLVRYCQERGLTPERVFRRDMVHLNEMGEDFLVEHIIEQARMYKAATGKCVGPRDLVFFQNVASGYKSREENTRIILPEYNLTSMLTENS